MSSPNVNAGEVMKSRSKFFVRACLLLVTIPALADKKLEGTSNLKDLQPYGTKDKEHKHQGYDFSFASADKSYVCRTDPSKSIKATDFVVGSEVKYVVDKNKGKIKNLQGKEVDCKIVRVEAVGSPVAHP
jgi:hypothetical protein